MASGPHVPGFVLVHRRGVLDQRLGHLPQPLDALGAREERLVAHHRVEDQTLVGLEHVHLVRRLLQRELQAQLVEHHAGSGPLAVERQ